MCFEKQQVTWLLETHVAFRGGVLVPLPRLGFGGTAVGICSVKTHIVNHAKTSHAHGGQNRAEGGREEPGEPRLHGVGDEAAVR